MVPYFNFGICATEVSTSCVNVERDKTQKKLLGTILSCMVLVGYFMGKRGGRWEMSCTSKTHYESNFQKSGNIES